MLQLDLRNYYQKNIWFYKFIVDGRDSMSNKDLGILLKVKKVDNLIWKWVSWEKFNNNKFGKFRLLDKFSHFL